MNKSLFVFCSVLFSLIIRAQEKEDKGVRESTLSFSRPSTFKDRGEILKQLQWEWTSLGPDETPPELNPGGKAIPAYTVGRGNGTGRINYLYVHPRKRNCLWACSPTGGIWYSTNNGEQWNQAGTDQLFISGASSVAVHPQKINQWVLATGDGDDLFMYSDGVWYTSDFGANYVSLNGTLENRKLPFGIGYDTSGQIGEVAASPRSLKKLFVASNRGLWTNNGQLGVNEIAWKKESDGYFYDIEIIKGKNKNRDIIVAAGDKLVISFNGGSTWEEMPLPSYPESDRYPFLRLSIEVSPKDPDKLFVAVTCSEAVSQSSSGEGTLQLFNLKSREWQYVRSLRTDVGNVIPSRARAFAVSPADPGVMLCGNVQPIFRSVDGGVTFSRIEKNQMHDDCHFIAFSPDGSTVWAAHDGGVSVSFDGGFHFKPRDKGLGASNVFGLSVAQQDEPQILYGGYDVGCNLLKNKEWSHVSWGDGFETITNPVNPSVMFTTMQNGGIQRSLDGKNFEDEKSPSGTKTGWHSWIRMHPTIRSTIYCSGVKLSRSRNLGDEWETIMNVKQLDSTLFNAYRFYLSEEHPSVMYVYVLDESYTHPQIWRSFNITEPDASKIVWEKVTEIPVDGWIMNISVDPEDPHRFWVLYNILEKDGKIWWYDGTTYIDYTANLGYSKCESMVLQKGLDKRLYLGSNYGVFTRSANDSQWTLLTGLPGTFIKSLDINYKARKLVVGTFGRGIWWGDLVR